MKKVVLMAILMILAIQVLCAQQLWPEPLNININEPLNMIETPDGDLLFLFSKLILIIPR